jgi:hypothetical protein
MIRSNLVIAAILAGVLLAGCFDEGEIAGPVRHATPQAAGMALAGACCFEDGTCQVLDADACLTAGGAYQGDDTSCDPNPCPQPPPVEGACCFEDGSCEVLGADACLTAGGVYQGDDTSCDPNPCAQPEPEGCGLGYWKNHLDAWEATAYVPEDLLGDVFTFPTELDFLANDTLMEALEYGGGNGIEGGARIMLRHCVAALLNASHTDVNYPFTEAEIISVVNAALASLDRKTMLDAKHEVDQHNSHGCPLN